MEEKEIVVGRYLTVSDSAGPPSISPIGLNNLRQDEQAWIACQCRVRKSDEWRVGIGNMLIDLCKCFASVWGESVV